MQLSMIWEETLTEEFLAELFSIPRPNLVSLTLSQQSQAVECWILQQFLEYVMTYSSSRREK